MEHLRRENVGQFTTADSNSEGQEGARLAQSVFLDELPGAAFAAITLIWILSSLASLVWREIPIDAIGHLRSVGQVLLRSHTVIMMSRAAGAASFAKAAYGMFDPRTPA
jgi:hypothetical protein